MTVATGKRAANAKSAKSTVAMKSHASAALDKKAAPVKPVNARSPLEECRKLRDQAHKRHAIAAALFWADKAVSLSGMFFVELQMDDNDDGLDRHVDDVYALANLYFMDAQYRRAIHYLMPFRDSHLRSLWLTARCMVQLIYD